MRFKVFFILILILFIFSNIISCQHTTSYQKPENTKTNKDLRTQNIEAVDQLLNNCNIILDKNRPIIVTTLVSVDNLTKSSTYGRMSAEIIANRLAQHGYNVKEIKMNQNHIYIKKQEGEFVLSRNLQNVANEHNVQGIVVGTYAIAEKGYGENSVYVCLKIVDPLTNRIGCSKCYTIEGYNKKSWQ